MRRKSWLGLWLACGLAMALPGCNQIINYPVPVLTSLSPASVTAGQPTFTLTVTGKGFVPNASVIEWNGTPLVTIAQSVNVMTASIPYNMIQNPGQVQVNVTTPQPGGGVTGTLTFTINPSAGPVPQITSISPTQIYAGSGGTTGVIVTILGSNFATTGSAQSTVSVNGNTTQANFVNSTALQLTLPPTQIAAAGSLQLAVVNPSDAQGKGGGSSNIVTLNVVNPVPIASAITPASAQAGFVPAAGNPYPTLTVTGMNLVGTSYIVVNGSQRVTAFSSSTQVSTVLTPPDFSQAGYTRVQVVTPGPGGGTSNVLALAVNPLFNAGLPVLVDFGPNGMQANEGVCGGSCSTGTPGLTNAGPSSDQTGRYIAFASISNDLVSGFVNTASDVFLRDTCLGTNPCTPQTSVISLAAGGGSSNGSSFQPSLSNDGTEAAFTSLATNLVTSVPVTAGVQQVYWELTCQSAPCTGTATPAAALVSISADGTSAGNGASYDPAISSDGRYVAFVSLATNLVSNVALDGVTPQIFLRDTCGLSPLSTTSTTCVPTTYLVSTPDGLTPGDGASSLPTIATNGAYIAFQSTATNLGASNPSGAQEIFLRTTCLPQVTTCTATTALASTPDGVTPADGASTEPSITADGRFVAYASTATTLAAGAGPTQQIYMWDTCTGAATTNPPCVPSARLVSTSNGTPGNALSENPSISQTTGEYVAFASLASNLAPGGANGVESIYVRNTCTGSTGVPASCAPSTVLGSRSVGNGAAANGASLVPSISPNGQTVSFLSLASNLVTGDVNGLEDIFLGSTTF